MSGEHNGYTFRVRRSGLHGAFAAQAWHTESNGESITTGRFSGKGAKKRAHAHIIAMIDYKTKGQQNNVD